MGHAAGIVLAGGPSSRMGAPKASLKWHDSTLLRRVTGIVARAIDGPMVVVRAPGQELPELDPAVEVVEDARPGRGPLQGLAAGLAAIGDRAGVAYVSGTDVPLLHPAFVQAVVGFLRDQVDIVLPEVGGYRQPLAAAYRTDVHGCVEELIAADRLAPGFLFERCRVLGLSAEALRAHSALARLDPELGSVINLNEPADYERAHAVPAPEIRVRRVGALAPPPSGSGPVTVRAWTLGGVAAAMGLALDERIVGTLNGDRVGREAQLPLAAGDAVTFTFAEAGG